MFLSKVCIVTSRKRQLAHVPTMSFINNLLVKEMGLGIMFPCSISGYIPCHPWVSNMITRHFLY